MAATKAYLALFLVALCSTTYASMDGGLSACTQCTPLTVAQESVAFPASARHFNLAASTPAIANAYGNRKAATPQSFPYLGFINQAGVFTVTISNNSINTPHSHPRGAEFIYLIEGKLTIGIVDEFAVNQASNDFGANGTVYNFDIVAGEVTVIPQGLIHFEINYNTTSSATFVQFFPTTDEGLQSTASSLFSSPKDAKASALGVTKKVAKEFSRAVNLPDVFAPLEPGAKDEL